MKILFALVFLIPIIVSAQELPFQRGEVVYELQITNPELSKSEIFSRTLSFLKTTLKKGSVFIQDENFEQGQILSRGTTAFNDRDKSSIRFEFGFAVWSKFQMEYIIVEGKSTIRIHDIILVKSDGVNESYRKLSEDVANGKMIIQGIKPGKARDKRQRDFDRKAEEINNTFYTLIALYKREIEK